jgi:peptide/nickel transport system substrate-binding protein
LSGLSGGKLKIKHIAAAVAVVAVSALVLSGCSQPYQSQVVSGTEITVSYNEGFFSYNSGSGAGNNTANGNIVYMANSGFTYYDDTPTLIRNTPFGSFEKTSDDPLTVEYTIADGVTWSDGVPVTAADLMLQWAAASGNVDSGTAFAPASTAGLSLVTQVPEISNNNKTVTLVYDKPYVDWELAFGVGVSAHGTYGLAMPDEYAPTLALWADYQSASADGKDAALKAYQDSAKTFGATAQASLVTAIQDGDKTALDPIAVAWNEGYAFTTMPDNPLMYLSNGRYVISDIAEDEYITISANPLDTWDSSAKFEKITVRTIADSTAALQALQNGELDIWSGQPTADTLAVAQEISTATVEQRVQASYEHLDLTFNNGGPFDPAAYGGDAEKALKVRQAFLKVIPRDEIVDKIIKPIDPAATVRNSFLVSPADEGKYATIVADNGSADYAGVDIEGAKALLAEAGVTAPVSVKFWYPEGNVRRGQEFELIAASAALAGFNLVDTSEPDWVFTDPSTEPINSHDAVIFAWSSTSLAISGSDQIFGTYTDPLQKGGNYSGYGNTTVDDLLSTLEVTIDPAEQTALQLQIEQQLWADAYGTTVFQFPGLLVSSDKVTGVKDNPLSPNFFWNYWEWTPVTTEG